MLLRRRYARAERPVHAATKQSAAWTDRQPTTRVRRYPLPESALAPELHVDGTAVADDHERLFRAAWNSRHSAGHARPVTAGLKNTERRRFRFHDLLDIAGYHCAGEPKNAASGPVRCGLRH